MQEAFRYSRRQLLVQFSDERVNTFAEELIHFAEAALGVEGRVFEVFGVEAEGIHDVVADELEPGGLGRREGISGVFAHDPVAVVAAHGVGEGREFLVDAAGAAEEGDEGGQFGERAGVGGDFVEAGVGIPDAEGREARSVLAEGGEHVFDLGEGDFLPTLGLREINGEGGELVAVIAAEALEILGEGGGAFVDVAVWLVA